MNALAGRLALVTGAGRGIGRAIALDLARAGADVIVNYNRSREQAEAVARQIEAMGRRAAAIQADVANKADIDRMFDAAEASSGPVNILVNNAGIEPRADVCDFDEATYDAVMATNLKGDSSAHGRCGRCRRRLGAGGQRLLAPRPTPTGFSALYG